MLLHSGVCLVPSLPVVLFSDSELSSSQLLAEDLSDLRGDYDDLRISAPMLHRLPNRRHLLTLILLLCIFFCLPGLILCLLSGPLTLLLCLPSVVLRLLSSTVLLAGRVIAIIDLSHHIS